MQKEYLTIAEVAGPIMVVEAVRDVAYAELVEIELPNGELRRGQVLEVDRDKAIVQLFEGASGLNLYKSRVRFLGRVMELGVSLDMLGRVFSGAGRPRDGGPEIIPEKRVSVLGEPINPYSRDYPSEFIQTGISAIDGLNTLVRGQKLPIFSGAGLPHHRIAAQIARQAKVLGKEEQFAIVFGAMGITFEEADFFQTDLRNTGALERAVLFINLADEPVVERILTPRVVLTTAEFLAFEKGMHVLVILIDMTNYAEALREVSAARKEVPGRRGYPGYMYSVDGSRRVVVKDPIGNVYIIRLADLFRKLSASSEVQTSADGLIERIPTPGWQALSVDGQGRSQWGPLKQILRHRYNGKLIKITSQAGETIVTPNHSVFTVVDDMIVPASAQELKVGDLLAHVNRIPPNTPTSTITPSLAALAGYYVSEGHALRYLNEEKGVWCHYVRIDNNNTALIEDIREKFKEVFHKYPSTFTSDKRSGTIRSSLGGKACYDMLVNILGCGTNSRTKRVPSQLFTAPLEVQEAFWEAYYKGDGKAQDPRYVIRQYDMVTISDGLRDDLMMLSKAIFPDRIPTFYKWRGRNAWKVYLSTHLKGRFKQIADVIGAEIKSIEWVEPTEPYVYDLSVEGAQNFVDACGGVLLHNTDLATIYERAGRIKGKKGSITQFPILTMPQDDKTHPIPDLTGYITEGQLFLSRELHRKGIYPPFDVLPCLSRLKDKGIGEGKTREDHAGVLNQLYSAYARGLDVREMAEILGEAALSKLDKIYLNFAEEFEKRFIQQGEYEDRPIEQTLDIGWELLALLPRAELKRVKEEHIAKYLPKEKEVAAPAPVGS